MTCKRCGRCCTKFALLHKFEDDIQKAINAINMHQDMRVIGRKDDHLVVAIDSTCNHLKIVDGMASCLIYDDRPEGCRNYYCPKCDEMKE